MGTFDKIRFAIFKFFTCPAEIWIAICAFMLGIEVEIGNNVEEIAVAFNAERYRVQYDGWLGLIIRETGYYLDKSWFLLRDHNRNIRVMSKEEFEERYDAQEMP